MKSPFSRGLLTAVSLGFASHGSAALFLDFAPYDSTVALGSSFSIDAIFIEFFEDASLGAYSLKVSYDPSIVKVQSVGFGSMLDLGGLGSDKFVDFSTPGLISFDETSFEAGSDLFAAQRVPAGQDLNLFSLASIQFQAVGLGTTVLFYDKIDLAGLIGDTLESQAFSGLISVVPEPGEYVLIAGLGLAGFAIWRRRS